MASNNDSAPPKHTFSLIPKIINGGIAGIIGVTLVFPLDLVKTRLQNQVVASDGTKQYKSMLNCFIQTYRAEGYIGMYKGSAINILLITPEKAIKLAGNDFFRFHYRKKDGFVFDGVTHVDGVCVNNIIYANDMVLLSPSVSALRRLLGVCERYALAHGLRTLPVPRQMLAGGSAGACQIIITTPMELLKIQMQMSGKAAADAKAAGKPFAQMSTLSLMGKLLKEKGIFGFYRGIGATATRDIFFSSIYFPLFATLNELGPGGKDQSHQPFWWTFMSGIVAGCCCAWLSTPFDVIKTRLQTGGKEFEGYFHAVFKTFRAEGLRAFFKGGACRIIVIAPLFGIAQAVYFLGIAEKLLGF